MVFAFSALAGVVSAGPEGVLDGLSGILMESLAKELGAEVTPTDAELFAAAFDDRSNAGEGYQFIRRGPATAVRAEGGGERREQMVVIMSLAEGFDVPIVFGDGGDDGLHLGHQGFDVND